MMDDEDILDENNSLLCDIDVLNILNQMLVCRTALVENNSNFDLIEAHLIEVEKNVKEVLHTYETNHVLCVNKMLNEMDLIYDEQVKMIKRYNLQSVEITNLQEELQNKECDINELYKNLEGQKFFSSQSAKELNEVRTLLISAMNYDTVHNNKSALELVKEYMDKLHSKNNDSNLLVSDDSSLIKLESKMLESILSNEMTKSKSGFVKSREELVQDNERILSEYDTETTKSIEELKKEFFQTVNTEIGGCGGTEEWDNVKATVTNLFNALSECVLNMHFMSKNDKNVFDVHIREVVIELGAKLADKIGACSEMYDIKLFEAVERRVSEVESTTINIETNDDDYAVQINKLQEMGEAKRMCSDLNEAREQLSNEQLVERGELDCNLLVKNDEIDNLKELLIVSERKIGELMQEKENLQKNNDNFEKEFNIVKEQLSNLQLSYQQSKDDGNQLLNQLQVKNDEIDNLEEQLSVSERKIGELMLEKENLQKNNEDNFEEEINIVKEQLSNLQLSYQQSKDDGDQLLSQLQVKNDEINNLEEQLSVSERKIGELMLEKENLQKNNDNFEKEFNIVKEQLSNLQLSYQQSKDDGDQLLSQLQSTVKEKEDLREEINYLREELDNFIDKLHQVTEDNEKTVSAMNKKYDDDVNNLMNKLRNAEEDREKLDKMDGLIVELQDIKQEFEEYKQKSEETCIKNCEERNLMDEINKELENKVGQLKEEITVIENVASDRGKIIEENQEKIVDVTNQLMESQLLMKQKEQDVDCLRQGLEQCNLENSELSQKVQLLEALETENKVMTETIELYETTLNDLKCEIQELNGVNQVLSNERQMVDDEVVNIKQQLEKRTAEVESLNNELMLKESCANKEMEKCMEELSNLKHTSKELETNLLNKLENELKVKEELENEINSLVVLKNSFQTKQDELSDELEKSLGEISKLKQSLEEEKKENEVKINGLQQINNNLQSTKNKELERNKEEIDELNKKIIMLENKLHGVSEEHSKQLVILEERDGELFLWKKKVSEMEVKLTNTDNEHTTENKLLHEKLTEAKQMLSEEIQIRNERENRLNESSQKLQMELTQLQQESKSKLKTFEKLNERIVLLEKENEEIVGRSDLLSRELKEFQRKENSEIKDKNAMIEILEYKVSEYSKEIDSLKEKMQKQSSQMDYERLMFKRKREEYMSNNDNRNNNTEVLQQEIVNLKNKNGEIINENEALKKELDVVQRKLNEQISKGVSNIEVTTDKSESQNKLVQEVKNLTKQLTQKNEDLKDFDKLHSEYEKLKTRYVQKREKTNQMEKCYEKMKQFCKRHNYNPESDADF